MIVEYTDFLGEGVSYYHALMGAGPLPAGACRHDHDETLFVHGGHITVRSGSELVTAGNGQVVTIPAGCPHEIHIDGDSVVVEVFDLTGRLGCLAGVSPRVPGVEVDL